MPHESLQVYLNCDIYFGLVPVGTTVVKSYPIKNSELQPVNFYITRNAFTNPIYYVFEVSTYEVRVRAKSEHILKISYTPNLPGSKDFDYFLITDNKTQLCRLSFRGECIGPSLSVSIRNLNFYKLPKHKQTKKVVVLTNKSEVPATFQFDVSEDQGAFIVEPLRGTLAPQEYEYITIKFNPSKTRFYARQLACLVLHDEPIILNLFGIYSKSGIEEFNETTFRYYPFSYEETVGFQAFFSDSVTIKRVPPPVSLTVNYLDFGPLKSEVLCNILTTSFTNHMDSGVIVDWEDVQMAHVVPKSLPVPSKQSALYECKLQPPEECVLTSVILCGQAAWSFPTSDSSSINVPIPISVRLIGYNFPLNQAWVPSVTITPINVVLPLTLPSLPSCTTFKIQAHGHLPVLYKLLPPDRTNFVIKPMVGLIRDFQIVAAQLQTCTSERKSYIEKWGIELNGQKQDYMFIYVKGQTDLPSVRVAYQNCIWFDAIQPGTKTSALVPLRNLSSAQIYYEFLLVDRVQIKPIDGILAANEEVFVTATYYSDFNQIGVQNVEVICRVRCILGENAPVGEHVDVLVKIVVDIVYSELCALPSTYECGEIEYDSFISTSFYIFNFGKSNVNFKLTHDYFEDVFLSPSMSKCAPNEKLMVKVEFTAKRPGKNWLFVKYNNRSFEYSEEVLSDEGAITLFTIEYKCIFPTIQALIEHNFGTLFTNDELIERFNIDDLNCALAETNPDEIRRVKINVPDYELSNKLFYLIFAMKNVSKFTSKMAFRRRQVCDCKAVEKENSTFRVKVFDCFHRDLFEIDPTIYNIVPQGSALIAFKIKYCVNGENMLSYSLDLDHRRTIHIDIYMDSIGLESYILSAYDLSYTLKMGHVFIGLREPPIFAYWLYNNSSKSVGFKIDDLEIVKLCNTDKFPVLKCVNKQGLIKPFSTAPLLFKFWPIETKFYTASVKVFLGTKQKLLTILGYGTKEKNMTPFANLMYLPTRPLINNIVSLSVDNLVIEPIVVSNFTERMFFIRNDSRTVQVQYSWQSCIINGLVKIEPLVATGILKPKESHPVFLKIFSLNEPCSIKVSLVLEFIDFDKLQEFQKMCSLTRIQNDKSTQEFAITDSQTGIPVMAENTQELVSPQIFHIILPISVNIVGDSDKDSCIRPKDQMRQRPWPGLQLNVSEFVEKYFEESTAKETPIHPPINVETIDEEIKEKPINLDVIQSVLDNVLGDAVFNEYFLLVLKNLKSEPSPFYSQIQLDDKRRDNLLKKETKKFLTQPDSNEVTTICEEVLIDAIQNTFKLGPRLRDETQKSNEEF